MPNYNLSNISAVSTSAELAHIRANQEPNQDSYNAAWLHGYADALAHAAEALEPQRKLMEAIIGYMGELNSILHDTLEMTDQEIRYLGFDLPQCRESDVGMPTKKQKGRKNTFESVTEGLPGQAVRCHCRQRPGHLPEE